jgi:hypothetical protein
MNCHRRAAGCPPCSRAPRCATPGESLRSLARTSGDGNRNHMGTTTHIDGRSGLSAMRPSVRRGPGKLLYPSPPALGWGVCRRRSPPGVMPLVTGGDAQGIRCHSASGLERLPKPFGTPTSPSSARCVGRHRGARRANPQRGFGAMHGWDLAGRSWLLRRLTDPLPAAGCRPGTSSAAAGGRGRRGCSRPRRSSRRETAAHRDDGAQLAEAKRDSRVRRLVPGRSSLTGSRSHGGAV